MQSSTTKAGRWAFALAIALMPCAGAGLGYAEDDEPAADERSVDADKPQNPDAVIEHPIGSKDHRPAEKNPDRPGHSPFGSAHGPAMDGVRGSAIGPAPGAFGTDAGSPSDLRR